MKPRVPLAHSGLLCERPLDRQVTRLKTPREHLVVVMCDPHFHTVRPVVDEVAGEPVPAIALHGPDPFGHGRSVVRACKLRRAVRVKSLITSDLSRTSDHQSSRRFLAD